MKNTDQDKKIEEWAKLYESTLDEGDFSRQLSPNSLIQKIQDEDPSHRSIVKIVLDGKFYDVEDVYVIEGDRTSDYLCIEGKSK